MKKERDCKYWELRKGVREAATLQELRKLHRELKPYGDGVLFFDRYPKARVPIITLARVVLWIVCIFATAFVGGLIGIGVVRLLSCMW